MHCWKMRQPFRSRHHASPRDFGRVPRNPVGGIVRKKLFQRGELARRQMRNETLCSAASCKLGTGGHFSLHLVRLGKSAHSVTNEGISGLTKSSRSKLLIVNQIITGWMLRKRKLYNALEFASLVFNLSITHYDSYRLTHNISTNQKGPRLTSKGTTRAKYLWPQVAR